VTTCRGLTNEATGQPARGILEKDELEPGFPERDTTLGHTLACRIAGLIDVGEDHVAVPRAGNAPLGRPPADCMSATHFTTG
jgi:hypothetical protein